MRHNLDLGQFLSQEGMADGKRHIELEYTFYGKMADPTQLERAVHKEEHEQWNLPVDSANGGKIRIRAINDMRFILTTKIKRDGQLGQEEVEVDISRDMFNAMREMAIGGMKKTRYVFKIEGSDKVWEIDVYKDSLGKDHPWVKIDLEIEKPSDRVPDRPVNFTELIVHQPSQQTDAEKAFIDKLWGQEWVSLDASQRLVK